MPKSPGLRPLCDSKDVSSLKEKFSNQSKVISFTRNHTDEARAIINMSPPVGGGRHNTKFSPLQGFQ